MFICNAIFNFQLKQKTNKQKKVYCIILVITSWDISKIFFFTKISPTRMLNSTSVSKSVYRYKTLLYTEIVTSVVRVW